MKRQTFLRSTASVVLFVAALAACHETAPKGAPTPPFTAQSGSAPAPVLSPSTAKSDDFYYVGADISWVQQREDAGTRYSDKGQVKDILAILKDHGFNAIRLRVFNDPTKATPRDQPYSRQGYCDLPHTITMAKRVKAAGMRLLIDFHYSDAWADPGKQYTPSAWANLSGDELAKALRTWTKDAVQQLKDAGATPDMVQVGNEITPGMMTDKGGTTGNWNTLASFLKAGIDGVHDVDPKITIMLHIDKGGDNRTARTWVQNALDHGVQFDVLGLSCYNQWQGPPAGWKANFTDLAQRFPNLKFCIAETDAQALAANDVMKSLPDNRGIGTFIWEPENGNANQQLFQPPGRGGAGRGRGAATATSPTTATASAPAIPIAVPTQPGTTVYPVLPERMIQYDQVVEKYHLPKLP